MMLQAAAKAVSNKRQAPAAGHQAAGSTGWTQCEQQPFAQRESIEVARMNPGILAQCEIGAEPSDDDCSSHDLEEQEAMLDLQHSECKEAQAWRTMEPCLRMHLCMVHESAIPELLKKDGVMDRPTLDARNNENRPLNWHETVAKLWNDPTLVLTTEALPDLHDSFACEIELKHEDMPGGNITADDVKSRFADCRAMLIKASTDALH